MAEFKRFRASPKHSWSKDDRIIISLLFLNYQNPIKDITAIFNHLQQNTLRAEGFSLEGLPSTSIRIQLRDLRNKGTGSPIFRKAVVASSDEFRAQREAIERAAWVLAIRLIPSRQQVPSQQEDAFRSGQNRNTDWCLGSADQDIDYYTPTKQPQKRPVSHKEPSNYTLKSFISAKVSHTLKGDLSRDGPYLLFRSFQNSHGLKTRYALTSRNPVPPPPAFESREYEGHARRHLTIDRSYDSRFLSFAQNPSVALKHAFQRSVDGLSVSLAVFKYKDIQVDALRRYGPNSGPYLVPSICRQHDLNDLPGGWTGAGEFLAWGSVEAEPVAIIPGHDALMLRAIMKTTTKLDYHSGKRLGNYLPNHIDELHLELLLYKLVTGFKTPGHRGGVRTKPAYRNFVQGAMSSRRDGSTKNKTSNRIRMALNEQTKQTEDPRTPYLNIDSDSDLEIIENPSSTSSSRVRKEDWRCDTD